MYWADEFADQIISSGNHKPYWVDDMKTPSGRVHIGSVRAVVSHYLIYKALLDKGQEAEFSYVFEDHDPMDKLPGYIDEAKFKQHVGKPLFMVPSPEEGYDSYGQRWGEEYKEIFNSIGIHPKIIWGSELYLSGSMNDEIRTCLDKADIIRGIYKRMYDQDKPSNWYPFTPVCENCGKLTTTTTSWDGDQIDYKCADGRVGQAEGCGHEGKKSPFSSKDNYAGKLPWKVEWPVKWKVIGVTAEGAGKDHMTEGGSHDFGKIMCAEVIDYPIPFHFSHEFFLVGGRKMSSSKGTGSSAIEVSKIIPPYLIRFMIVRVKYNRAINFDPHGATIPDLFDAYDKSAHEYWDESDKKLSRIYELSQLTSDVPQRHFLPRFRDITRFAQDPKLIIKDEVQKIKGGNLTDFEEEVLEERVKYAKIWLNNYASKEDVFLISDTIPEEVEHLSSEQKAYLLEISIMLGNSWNSPEDFQQTIYQKSKDMGLKAKDAFQSIYIALSGKTHGPKAAWVLLENSKVAIKRFEDIQKETQASKTIDYKFNVLKDSFITIDKSISDAYPSMNIAMAIIEGVNNSSDSQKFIDHRNQMMEEIGGVAIDDINQSRKIRSYRKAIKESGIDWHSRRPTMEALLRRVAQGKELRWINPLVDIGNLMAMKHHASQGVFDLDNLNSPVVMRKSDGGEKVLMIGDNEETTLKKGEICYFDQEGPFIVDLCWRDAQRTGATKNTKNVLFLSEAVYEINRHDLEEVLEDLISTTTKYIGGKVKQSGIITI